MAFNRLRNRSGTSLAEVMVVAIILVTGILVVMRVFPVGFSSLRHAENVSIAGRLAQQEIDKWNNRAANLPAGILPIFFNELENENELALNLMPGPPIDSDKLWPYPVNPALKNSECFRRVMGEVTKIPIGTYFDIPGETNVGAMYVMGFSPVEVRWKLDDTPQNLIIYGGNMRGRVYDSQDGSEPWLRLGSRYGIDYERGKICFAKVGEERTYRISYSYWISSSKQLNHVVDETLTIGADTAGWQLLPGLPSDASVDEGSERVARAFDFVPWTEDWTPAEPYEYKLVDPITGIIAFNPAGHGHYETTELGVRPLEAHIDYDIMDLQIISEERTVPLTAPYHVKLTLPFIKEKYKTMEATAAYQGLGGGRRVGYGAGVDISPDILIVNPADGAKLLPRNEDPDLPGANPNFSMEAEDFKSGTIRFGGQYVRVIMPSGTIVDNYNIAGKTLRFYYQAYNDWSVQLHKAYEKYVGKSYATASADMDVDYRQYISTVDNPKRLYFKLCDAEKTVAVTYKWKPAEDSKPITEIGETHQLDKYIEMSPNRKFVYLDLKARGSIEEIVTVAGISLKARALWREREKWMYSDVESSLTRRPSEL